ncbi:metal-sulfur cluster assembly factor [Candidatus Woesearchaeota archaeon]|nr:metal-sulfur cluster assembly factor [Candidatus Woesearchaeota archaeon]
MVTQQQVIQQLKKVQDPELGVDIWTLGLVYKITLEKAAILILMTLTSPMCPYGPMLVADVQHRIKELKGVKDVKVDVTFTPPWKPSEDVRTLLGV